MRLNVVVTGGCGFIGREVVSKLLKKNYQVTVVDNLSNSILLAKQDGLKFFNIDLRENHHKLEGIFNQANYCLHLAAQVGGIKLTGSYSSELVLNNLRIDANALKLSSQVKLKKVIYISSTLVYEQVKRFPLKEADALNLPAPVSSYAFAKWTGERVCQFLAEDKKINFSILRLANVYGINQNILKTSSHLHVIPDLIIKILKGQTPLKIYGDGKQKRSFVHVKDVAEAIVVCMESTKSDNQIFNVASSKETEILELAKKIWQLCGRKEPLVIQNENAAQFDPRRSFCDVRKIKKTLNWQAKVSLDQGLQELIDFLKKNYDFKVN